MGDEIVSEFMRERRAKMKTEEKTLKEFIKDLQNFRKAAAVLNETGIAVLDVFDKPQQELADRFGLSAVEKRIAFDRDAKSVQPQPEPDEKHVRQHGKGSRKRRGRRRKHGGARHRSDRERHAMAAAVSVEGQGTCD